jgi:hypothetical protein
MRTDQAAANAALFCLPHEAEVSEAEEHYLLSVLVDSTTDAQALGCNLAGITNSIKRLPQINVDKTRGHAEGGRVSNQLRSLVMMGSAAMKAAQLAQLLN